MFDDLETEVGCVKALLQELEDWRQFEKERLSILNQRKLLKYLILRLKNPDYFHEQVDLCTYEARIHRFILDIGAIVKR